MTVADYLRICLRRWPVVLLGLLVTAGLVISQKSETVYWSRVTAMVMTPVSQTASLTLENQGRDAVATATLLATRVNGGTSAPRSASADATLYGEGYRQATSARVRNYGSQWRPQFRDALIDVEVVARSPTAVQAEMSRQVSGLTAQLTSLQDTLAVPEAQRLTLSVAPAQPVVAEVSSSRLRAMLAFLAFGIGMTIAATYWFDRWRQGMKASRARARQPAMAT